MKETSARSGKDGLKAVVLAWAREESFLLIVFQETEQIPRRQSNGVQAAARTDLWSKPGNTPVTLTMV